MTGLCLGKYKDKDHIEIILSSLSGLVFSLTPEINYAKKTKSIDAKSLMKKIEAERNTIENLTKKLNDKKIEFEKNSKTSELLVKNNFKVNYKFSLIFKQSVFQLTVDSEFPMEMVLLFCPKTKKKLREK